MKVWEFVGQLKGEGGEDKVKVTTVLEVMGIEERHNEPSVNKHLLADCLGNRRLVSPGEPVQPEDRRPLEVFGP